MKSARTEKIDGQDYFVVVRDVTMDSHPAYTGEKRLVDTAGPRREVHHEVQARHQGQIRPRDLRLPKPSLAEGFFISFGSNTPEFAPAWLGWRSLLAGDSRVRGWRAFRIASVSRLLHGEIWLGTCGRPKCLGACSRDILLGLTEHADDTEGEENIPRFRRPERSEGSTGSAHARIAGVDPFACAQDDGREGGVGRGQFLRG